jgi:Zn-dependent M32 family carboxypeptidase
MKLEKFDEIVNTVKQHDNDFWDKQKQDNTFMQLADELSVLLDLPKPQIDFNGENHVGAGNYDRDNNVIHLPKRSLVTFLHEFFHAVFSDEVNPRIISTMIFARAYPDKLVKLTLTEAMLLTQKGFDQLAMPCYQ